jgi:hypothetical protein
MLLNLANGVQQVRELELHNHLVGRLAPVLQVGSPDLPTTSARSV